jgi:hypothetical protein
VDVGDRKQQEKADFLADESLCRGWKRAPAYPIGEVSIRSVSRTRDGDPPPDWPAADRGGQKIEQIKRPV